MVSHEQETALLGLDTQQMNLFCWNGFERLNNKRSLGEGDVAGSGREKNAGSPCKITICFRQLFTTRAAAGLPQSKHGETAFG